MLVTHKATFISEFLAYYSLNWGQGVLAGQYRGQCYREGTLVA